MEFSNDQKYTLNNFILGHMVVNLDYNPGLFGYQYTLVGVISSEREWVVRVPAFQILGSYIQN